VVFVLDASPSMSARDFGQSRFDICKGILSDFAMAGGNASLGLVAFGNEAVLAVPPTEDRRFFLDRLATLAPGAYGEGTAIGMGIATAVFHLRGSQAPSRLIVVFTDGENNSGTISPMRAAELAADARVQLILIGVGSRGEVLVSWTDPKTGKEMEGRYSSDFDEASMARIAERSGGSFMAARDAQAMKSVKAQVIRASAALGRTRESRHSSSLAPALLALALAALSFGIAIECLAGEASACP
jgi:Ca-activated chloride channel homolog